MYFGVCQILDFGINFGPERRCTWLFTPRLGIARLQKPNALYRIGFRAGPSAISEQLGYLTGTPYSLNCVREERMVLSMMPRGYWSVCHAVSGFEASSWRKSLNNKDWNQVCEPARIKPCFRENRWALKSGLCPCQPWLRSSHLGRCRPYCLDLV